MSNKKSPSTNSSNIIRAALLPTALFCVPAFGQQQEHSQPAAPESAQQIQTVTISGTTAAYDNRRDDTATMLVVTREDMLKFGDSSLADALKRQPGITVDSGPKGGIQMRGLGNGYTQILLNGEKAPAGFSIESLTPEVIERIEILRVVTADMRTEGIAGTINIVLRKVPHGKQRELKLALAEARGKPAPTASWQLSDRTGTLSYTMSGTLARREFLGTEHDVLSGVDANGAPDELRIGMARGTGHTDALTLAPGATIKLDNGDTVALQAFVNGNWLKKDADVTSDTLFGPVQDYASNRQLTDDQLVQIRSDLNWTHRFAGGAKLDVKLGASRNQKRGAFKQRAFDVDHNLNLDDLTSSHVSERGVNSTGKFSAPYLDKHALGVGWEASLSRRNEDRIEQHQPIPGIESQDSDMDFVARVGRLGLYVQDEWTWSPRFSVYAGVRWEVIGTRSEGNSFDPISNREHVLSPVLQSLWKLPGTENDQLRVALSRTYKTPEISSLIPRPYTSTNNTALDPDTRGNPALHPELALGLDVAFEHYWPNNAMLSIGGYARKISDFIRTDLKFIDRRWVAFPVNGGDARTRGLELEGKLPFKALFAGSPDLDVRANLTRNWSFVEQLPSPYNRVDGQLRLSATGGIDYRESDRLTVGASFSFKSGGPVRTGPNTLDYTGARRELDMYSLWKVGAASKLRLSLNNVLHQDVRTGAAYLDQDGRLVEDQRRISPLTIRLAWEARY
jgi:outer membrane receptor for ferrienterochelin and colicins